MITFTTENFEVALGRAVRDLALGLWPTCKGHQTVSEDGITGRMELFFDDADQADADACEVWLASDLEALAVNVDTPSLVADGINEAIITCSDPALSGATSVQVSVWLNDAPYMLPTAYDVVGGVVTLELQPASNETGTFVIAIQTATNQVGLVQIEATT